MRTARLPCSRRGRSRSRDIISVRQPLALAVAQVHARQVGGEQRRLVAAGAGADLEEGVARVVGVARQQRGLQLEVAGARGRRSAAAISSRAISAIVASSLDRRAARCAAARSRSRCSKRRKRSTSAATSACSRVELAKALHVGGDAGVGERRVELAEAQREAFELLAKGVFHGEALTTERAASDAGARAAAAAQSVANACRRPARGALPRRNRRDTVCASCARSLAVGGVQLGQRAVQHLLRQAARQRLEHRVDVLAAWRAACARARSRARASRRPARCSAWISGTEPRWSSQCTKLCTPVSMIASACATAAWRFSPADLHQRRQVVDGVEVDVGQARDLGLDVARHRQVDHEHRPVAARLQRALDRAQADDRQRARGARDDDVELGQARRQVGQAHRFGAEARGRALSPRSQRAVGDRHRARLARREMGRRRARSSRRRRRTAPWSRAGPRTAARPGAPPPPPC